MTAASELWQGLVYCAETARGSPKGVLLLGSSLLPDHCHSRAPLPWAILTPFSSSLPAAGAEWRARSFSPAQRTEPKYAGPDRRLRCSSRKIRRDSTVFNSSGPITVSELVAEPNDVAWLAGPHRILERSVSRSSREFKALGTPQKL